MLHTNGYKKLLSHPTGLVENGMNESPMLQLEA
jgi:hypothetical protein